jgi:hypothetical protein
MKSILIGFTLMTSITSFASTLEIVCQDDGNRLVISTGINDQKTRPSLDIYNQGGLGPNFLEAGYTASEGYFQISPDNSLSLSAKYMDGGKFDVEFLDATGEGGLGNIIYPGTKKVIKLKNCSFTIK